MSPTIIDKNKNRINNEHCIRTIVIGGENCGKTSLVERYSIEVFPIRPIKTVALTSYNKRIQRDADKIVNLQITDTTGNTNSMEIVLNSLSNVKYAIVCYDLGNPKSWDDSKEWVRAIRAKSDCKLILCGTKSDKIEAHTKRETILNYEKGLQIEGFQTSAKLGDNIIELFDYLLDDYFAELAQKEAAKNTLEIDDSTNKRNKGQGCGCILI